LVDRRARESDGGPNDHNPHHIPRAMAAMNATPHGSGMETEWRRDTVTASNMLQEIDRDPTAIFWG
jgi:hypothetical protein